MRSGILLREKPSIALKKELRYFRSDQGLRPRAVCAEYGMCFVDEDFDLLCFEYNDW